MDVHVDGQDELKKRESEALGVAAERGVALARQGWASPKLRKLQDLPFGIEAIASAIRADVLTRGCPSLGYWTLARHAREAAVREWRELRSKATSADDRVED